MDLLLAKAKEHFQKNLPFALYSKPNLQDVIGVFQQNNQLFSVVDFNENGFVFASFDGAKIYFIPESQSDKLIATIFPFEKDQIHESIGVEINQDEKNRFEDLISNAIESINKKEFKKVVVSRKEILEIENFDLGKVFKKLLELYSNTFVYCFFHPKVGFWFGATPEQLLRTKNGVFETVSLAGTQKDQGLKNVFWPKKEVAEQQYVTDYIVDALKKYSSGMKVSNSYSSKAGKLWHIRTDISGKLEANSDLQKTIALLHPTPAVCGLPKDESKAFIQQNENYQRTFYTGYLGELNLDNTTDLFVNLRCMEIKLHAAENKTEAHLYMGCGITKDSSVQKEWEESCNKSLTMKRVLL